MNLADGTPIAEIVRYRRTCEDGIHGMDHAPKGKGDWVRYTDHVAALAEVAERERVMREALEEAENKLRAHDGLAALKNGIPETTGDPVFDQVLRVYPVAAMLQRQWLGSATGFDDLPFLKKSLLRFFEASDLGDLLDPEFFQKRGFGRPRLCVATPAPEPTQPSAEKGCSADVRQE